MMRQTLLAAGVACAVVCTPDLCTQLGCGISPWISIIDDITSDGRLRAGVYTFRLEAEYAKVEWECEVKQGAADSACSEILSTTGELDGQWIFWRVEAANGPNGVQIALVEFRDDASVVIGPAQFSLAVTRDGAQLVNKSYSPTYSGSWINGEGCAPYCAQATEPIELHLAP